MPKDTGKPTEGGTEMSKDQWISERTEAYEATGTERREAIGLAVADWYDMNTPAEDY